MCYREIYLDRDPFDRNGPEETVKPTQMINRDIRRHPNDSIDFDFYRARAAALRGQAMRDAFTLRAVGAIILTMTGVLAVVFLVAAACGPACRTGWASNRVWKVRKDSFRQLSHTSEGELPCSPW
jgi:hypothetical protein